MKIPCNRPAGGTATGVTATGGGSAPPLYREALVVFAGNSDIWWLGGLKSGFRHCFIAFNDGRHWITLDPLSHRTEVMVQEVPADFDLRAFYEERGMRCVTAALAPTPLRCGAAGPVHLRRSGQAGARPARTPGLDAAAALPAPEFIKFFPFFCLFFLDTPNSVSYIRPINARSAPAAAHGRPLNRRVCKAAHRSGPGTGGGPLPMENAHVRSVRFLVPAAAAPAAAGSGSARPRRGEAQGAARSAAPAPARPAGHDPHDRPRFIGRLVQRPRRPADRRIARKKAVRRIAGGRTNEEYRSRFPGLRKQFERLKEARRDWEPVWRDCYAHALPLRSAFGTTATRTADPLFDGTAPDAVDQLAASLLAETDAALVALVQPDRRRRAAARRSHWGRAGAGRYRRDAAGPFRPLELPRRNAPVLPRPGDRRHRRAPVRRERARRHQRFPLPRPALAGCLARGGRNRPARNRVPAHRPAARPVRAALSRRAADARRGAGARERRRHPDRRDRGDTEAGRQGPLHRLPPRPAGSPIRNWGAPGATTRRSRWRPARSPTIR